MYLADLRAAAPSAAEPATWAAVATYESANGHTTVTSQIIIIIIIIILHSVSRIPMDLEKNLHKKL